MAIQNTYADFYDHQIVCVAYKQQKKLDAATGKNVSILEMRKLF